MEQGADVLAAGRLMQLPIQSGVRVKDRAFATSYPANLEHRVIVYGRRTAVFD